MISIEDKTGYIIFCWCNFLVFTLGRKTRIFVYEICLYRYINIMCDCWFEYNVYQTLLSHCMRLTVDMAVSTCI